MCMLMSCLFSFNVSYNPLERRETSKGGKEGSKKSASSQSSTKSSTAASKTQTSHNARRNDAIATNQSVKASRPSSREGPAYDEQVVSVSSKENFVLTLRKSNALLLM